MNYKEIAIKSFLEAAGNGVVVFTYNDKIRTATINKKLIERFLECPDVKGEVSASDFIPKEGDLKGVTMIEIISGSKMSCSIKRFNFDKIEWSL